MTLVNNFSRYELRLFIDESISFGTLGDNCRGITDYYDIPMKEVRKQILGIYLKY